MSKTTRRTAAERAEAKNARAYVEMTRRRVQAGLQETLTKRLNDLIDEETARPSRRRGHRAHIYTACIVLGILACSFPSALTVALLYLATRP